MFLKTYIYYGGYKDGFHGFVISLLEGTSRSVRHIKIWQYTRELDKKDLPGSAEDSWKLYSNVIAVSCWELLDHFSKD